MVALLALLVDFVARLDRRAQRVLLACCTSALVLFAGTTVAAAQRGDYSDMTAGAMLLAALAVLAAVVWSARRTTARRG
jgi:hypothetical protein